jgi:antitoxin MazE
MKTQFVKWGNSLALRVPSAFADEVGATEGKRAVMTVENGALVVKVVERTKKRRRYSLEQLLAGLSREDEINWGQPRGREVW